jgi:hypothetical protein
MAARRQGEAEAAIRFRSVVDAIADVDDDVVEGRNREDRRHTGSPRLE